MAEPETTYVLEAWACKPADGTLHQLEANACLSLAAVAEVVGAAWSDGVMFSDGTAWSDYPYLYLTDPLLVPPPIDELDPDMATLDADLQALAALSANGLVTRTAPGAMAARTVQPGSPKVTVANGNGVAGNPTVDVVEPALSLTNLGGVLPTAKGGTGQTTPAAALNTLLPAQSGQGGKVLGTDGAAPSWVAPPAGGASGAEQVTWTPPWTNSTPLTVAAYLTRSLNVVAFGALGNGTTDDTLPIQRAIDTANAMTAGSPAFAVPWTVYLPPGFYRHSGLILKNRVILRGAGPGATTLFLISGSNKHSVTNIDPANASYATGFQRAGLMDLTIHGGWTRSTNVHFGTGPTSQGADDGSWATSYDGFHLETHGTIGTNAAVAPELTGDPRCIFRNVEVRGCAGSGVVLGGPGMYANGASYLSFGSGSMVVSNIQVFDCRRYGLWNLMNDQHFVGIEVGPCDWGGIVADGAQCAWANCKSWYSGRDSTSWSLAKALYTTAQASTRLFLPRQFGTPYLIKDNNSFSVCKSQDSAGHGAVIDGVRVLFNQVNLDQVGELGRNASGVVGTPTGAAEWETLNSTTTDRYGVWINGTSNTFCHISGVLTSKNNQTFAKSIVRTRGAGNYINVSGLATHYSSANAVERDAGVTTPYTYNGAVVA